MTPFGIRKRLKKLLGLGGAPESEEDLPPRKAPSKISITLVNPEGEEDTCEAPEGSSVLFATGNLMKPLGSGCADATCATCRVEVIEGDSYLSPQSARERATLKENSFSPDMRLGCQAEIRGVGARVKVRGFEFVT